MQNTAERSDGTTGKVSTTSFRVNPPSPATTKTRALAIEGTLSPAPRPQPTYSLEATGYSLAGTKFAIPGWVNQHAYLVRPLSATKIFFGVFDGYGIHGNHIVKAVRNCFSEAAPLFPSPTSASLPAFFAEAFEYADAESARTGFLVGDSGTYVTVGIVDIVAQVAAIAHVGNSLVMVANRSGITYQSSSHEASQPGHASQGALYDPMITTNIEFTPESVLTVASHGVWQRLEVREAAGMSLQEGGKDTAEEMVSTAHARCAADQGNGVQEFTAVVVQSYPQRAMTRH